MGRRAKVYAIAATLFAVVVLGATLLVVRDDGGPAASRQPQGPREVTVREVYMFDSVAEMLATSDAVIVGRVLSTARGRTVGDGAAAITFRSVEVAVERTIKGDIGGRVTLEEEGWDAAGPYHLAGVPWATAGSRSYFFLTAKSDAPGAYRLTNTQGRIDLVAGGARSTDHYHVLDATVNGRTASEIDALMSSAVAAVAAGEVKRASPTIRASADHTPVGPVQQLGAGKDENGAWRFIAVKTASGYCYGLGYAEVTAERCFLQKDLTSALERGGLVLRSSSPRAVVGVFPASGGQLVAQGATGGRAAGALVPIDGAPGAAAGAVALAPSMTPGGVSVIVTAPDGRVVFEDRRTAKPQSTKERDQ